MRLIRLAVAVLFLLSGGVLGVLNMQPIRLDLGLTQIDAALGVLVIVLLLAGTLLGAALLALDVLLPMRRRLHVPPAQPSANREN